MASQVAAGPEQINDDIVGGIEQYLQSRLEYAEAGARKAEHAHAAERDVMVAFHRDGTLPEDVARRVSIRTHDAVTEAGTAVLTERSHRSVFDQAKAARDALDAWLTRRGLTDGEETAVGAAPAHEPDEALARQVIFQYLDARVDAAREKAANALAGAESAREELAIFQRDRRISAESVEEVWFRTADAVVGVGMKVLEGHATRAEFDEAKANRTAVLEWIHAQGFRVDTSRICMAELPD